MSKKKSKAKTKTRTLLQPSPIPSIPTCLGCKKHSMVIKIKSSNSRTCITLMNV